MPTVAVDARDAFAPHLRGWGRYTRELVRCLGERDGQDELRFRFLERGGRGPELLWEQLALPRLLRGGGYDAVHATNCFLPLRRPCPGVVTIHDLAFEDHPGDFAPRTRWKYRTLAPRAARSAERVICVSAFTRDDVIARYGAAPERVHVVHPAAALPLTGAEPPPGPYLLAVGDLRRKKNFARLAEAFALLHAEGLPHRLVIAGLDSGEREHIVAAAGAAPLELPGYVSDERLDALMRGADLLVHPSLYEGFGLVLVEAMARGTPVAAARATALPETGAGAAVYFDPHDARDMADSIRSVLEDASLRERLVASGRERAAGFSWRTAAERTMGVYREAIG